MAVATTLNVTKAGEIVHLAQSSVTEQIQVLEADVGAALFDRTRQGLQLTEAGRRLFDYAGDILALVDEAQSAVAEAAGLETGELTVGGLETLCANHLPPLLAAFRHGHPGNELHLVTANSGELINRVKAGTVDACFRFGDMPSDPDLHSECVAQERLVVIAPPGHHLGRKNVIQAEDLSNESFLVTERGCVYRQMFERAFPETSRGRPEVVGEFGSIATILHLVETGVGCAIVPQSIVDENSRVITVPWIGDADTVPIYMAWCRRRAQSTNLGVLLQEAREYFAAPTPDDARHRRGAVCP